MLYAMHSMQDGEGLHAVETADVPVFVTFAFHNKLLTSSPLTEVTLGSLHMLCDFGHDFWQSQTMEGAEEGLDEGSKGINEQASYAANKLRQLYDKLEYKRQALGSIQNAPKPDKKVRHHNQPAVPQSWLDTKRMKI